jgi:hypothetical protein
MYITRQPFIAVSGAYHLASENRTRGFTGFRDEAFMSLPDQPCHSWGHHGRAAARTPTEERTWQSHHWRIIVGSLLRASLKPP